MRTLVLTVMLAAATGACESEKFCTLVGCDADGFEIHAAASSPLADGGYRIDITLDDKSGSCEFAVPITAGTTSCDPSLTVALTPNANGFVLAIRTAPRSVSIHVLRDGQLIGQDDYEPDYQTSRPNGPDCEPECHSAKPESLVLQP